MILDKSLVDYSTGEPFEIEPPLECSITNPSVMQIQSGYQVLCRGMLNQKNLTTQNICHFFAENLDLLSSMVIDDSDVRSQFSDCENGLEDGRLFLWNNKTWAIFTGLKYSDSGYRNTMIIGEISNGRLINVKVLKSPHELSREKNWMPCVIGERLFFLYTVTPLEIYEFSEGNLNPVFKKDLGLIRKSYLSGSSQVIEWGDGYLAITHTRHPIGFLKKIWMKYFLRDENYKVKKTYFLHQLIKFNKNFEVTRVSKDFYFESLGVEFCAGIALAKNGLLISYGVADTQAKMLRVPSKKIEELLQLA